jgi:hypothetical protein
MPGMGAGTRVQGCGLGFRFYVRFTRSLPVRNALRRLIAVYCIVLQQTVRPVWYR